jgi:hypothetical protein
VRYEHVPDYRVGDDLVVVPQDVADPSDILPRNGWLSGFEFLRDTPAGFRNDLDLPFHGTTDRPPSRVGLEVDHPNGCFASTFDRV